METKLTLTLHSVGGESEGFHCTSFTYISQDIVEVALHHDDENVAAGRAAGFEYAIISITDLRRALQIIDAASDMDLERYP